MNRNFRADEPNRLWLTDITEFRLPGGEGLPEPVIDCFDGMPVEVDQAAAPDKRLANSSLLKACAAARPAGARTTIHSDRGGQPLAGWIGICEGERAGQSMSAKGCSPDKACEGFFGRLKNEFFHYRDWRA